jgi:uncharacterized protein (TIGR02266 family)
VLTAIMTAKTILIAHRHAPVRDRFAVALADARHEFMIAQTERDVRLAAADRSIPVSLAILDLGLSPDGIGLVRAVRESRGPDASLAVVVFAGTIASTADIPHLAAMRVGYINEFASTPQILPALAPHLFPDNFNRRASARVVIGLPVSCQTGETIVGAITRDVGKGGIAIRTMSPLPVGTATRVRLRLPGTIADIHAGTRVAWSHRNVGMGVQFEQISAIDQRAVDDFVDGR